MHNIGMISFKYADQPPDQILEGYIPQFPIIFFFFFKISRYTFLVPLEITNTW